MLRRRNREKTHRGSKKLRKRDVFDFVFQSPWPWAGLLLVLFAGILTPGLSYRVQEFELGDVASVTIRAPLDFSYEDEVTTLARRDEAAAAVLEIFNFNDVAKADAKNRIAAAFEFGRDQMAVATPFAGSADGALAMQGQAAPEIESGQSRPGDGVPAYSRDELTVGTRDRLQVTLGEDELDLLIEHDFSVELEQVLTQVVTHVLSRDIVSNKDRLLASGRPITRQETIGGSVQVRRDFSNILSVDEAQDLLIVQMASSSDLRQSERAKLTRLGAAFVEPTLNFDFAATQRARTAARLDVDPVYYHVPRGKTIVRAGDEIDESALRQIRFLASQQDQQWGLAGAVGAVLFAGIMLMLLWYLLRPLRAGGAWRRKSFAMVGLIIASHLLLARLAFSLARLVSEQSVVAPFSNTTSYFYAVPFAAVAVLILLLEHTPTALLASTLFSVALGVMTGNLQLAVFCLVSCLAAILGLFQYKRRTALFKLGLWIGSVNFVAVLAIDLLSGRYFPVSTFSFDLLCAFLGGASVSVIVSFLLPAFESLFQRTTDIRLLELANNNVPVLRRLALEAPRDLSPQHGRRLIGGGGGGGDRRERGVLPDRIDVPRYRQAHEGELLRREPDRREQARQLVASDERTHHRQPRQGRHRDGQGDRSPGRDHRRPSRSTTEPSSSPISTRRPRGARTRHSARSPRKSFATPARSPRRRRPESS